MITVGGGIKAFLSKEERNIVIISNSTNLSYWDILMLLSNDPIFFSHRHLHFT